jgi:tight adherence protein B
MTPVTIVTIFAFLVLFAVVLIAVSVGYRFLEAQRKSQVQGMLQTISGTSTESETTILVDPGAVNPFDTFLNRSEIPARLGRMIQQGGMQWTVSRLLIAIGVAGLVGAVIGITFNPLGFTLLSMLALALLLGSLPYLYLRYRRNKRMGQIEEQLPEALDFLARSMRAGHAFSISLEMLGEESPDPLGQEFRVLFNEQNLGAPIEVALSNMADRVPLLDIRLLVSAVSLQKQTGGNLSEILVKLAEVIRERFRLRGQVKAASAHGRMTAAVLTVLPIILMLSLLFIAPGYLQGMATDSIGKWMVLGAVGAQVAGYFIMRGITNIKV